jgi:hypothetical protein
LQKIQRNKEQGIKDAAICDCGNCDATNRSVYADAGILLYNYREKVDVIVNGNKYRGYIVKYYLFDEDFA